MGGGVMPSQPLLAQDLLVEWRDRNLVRQGSIPPREMDLKLQPVFNGIGSWSLNLPAEHRAVPYLRAPGSGIIVTNIRTGDVVLSGPTSAPSKRSTSSDVKGMATIAGLSDDRLLWDAEAYPTSTTDDVTAQTDAYDVRTAKTSTLMRAYVNANIGPGAPAGRRSGTFREAITLGGDPNIGTVITKRARFDNLGEFLKEIALVDGLGFRIIQIDDDLQFQVYQPQDRTAFIRLDVKNGTLSDQSVETSPADVTRVIVAGQGDLEERQFVEVTTPDSLDSESLWGLRIEEFKDQRQTNVEDELETAGIERLNEAGFTKVALKAQPSNDNTMVFMKDFGLGDLVSVVIDGQETHSNITEAAIIVNSGGINTAVAIGDIADFDSASALRNTVADTVRRVSSLERTVGTAYKSLQGSGAEVTDWDDAFDIGFYWGTGAANAPTPGDYYVGQVLNDGAHDRVTQILYIASQAGTNARKEYRRTWASGVWGDWHRVGSTDLPATLINRVASSSNITSASDAWTSTAASVTITPVEDLLVEASAGGELLTSTTAVYAMLGVLVSGGVTLDPPVDQGGTSGMYGLWAPFTYSATYHNQQAAPKPIVIPKGVPTTFACAALRNGTTGTQTINYPTVMVRPVRWV